MSASVRPRRADDILGSSLEALQIDPSTPVAWNIDHINPEPKGSKE